MEITFEQLPKAVINLQETVNDIKRMLLDKSNKPLPDADQLLNIQQVAEMLTLSVPTIYGLVSRSAIPCMKKGKRLYFSKEEITKWLRSGRKSTIAEINSEVDSYLLKNKKGGMK